MNLLCAVMVGTSCVAWHPKGTKKGDIAEYYSGYLAHDSQHDPRAHLVCDVTTLVRGMCYCGPYCDLMENHLKLALAKDVSNYYVEWSLTKTQLAESRRERRLNEMSPLERQHESACSKADKYGCLPYEDGPPNSPCTRDGKPIKCQRDCTGSVAAACSKECK